MKNTVLLLFLGSLASTGNQFNGMANAIQQQTENKADQKIVQTEQAVASSKVEGKGMIEVLAKTDIDMSSFEKLLGKQKMKTKDADEEEEEEENQESSDKSSEEKEDESKSEDKKESSDKKEEDQRLNGRDKNGMYKNHKNYVNLRNKINE